MLRELQRRADAARVHAHHLPPSTLEAIRSANKLNGLARKPNDVVANTGAVLRGLLLVQRSESTGAHAVDAAPGSSTSFRSLTPTGLQHPHQGLTPHVEPGESRRRRPSRLTKYIAVATAARP